MDFPREFSPSFVANVVSVLIYRVKEISSPDDFPSSDESTGLHVTLSDDAMDNVNVGQFIR